MPSSRAKVSQRRSVADNSHSGPIITASVILMNSSFLSMASRAPRTLSATSAAPRCSTQFVSSIMAASRASWFSLILNNREGSMSECGIANPPWTIQHSSRGG